MQSLSTMIRLSKFQLDEKRRKMKELRDFSQQLQTSLETLRAEQEREQRLVGDSIHAQRLFHEYCKGVETRRRNLLASIEQVEMEINQVTNDMADAFQELKRFELTQSEREEQSAKQRQHQEDAVLDEYGLQAFKRSI